LEGIFPGADFVLGLGMAFTVAPLTTVVMSSVDQDRAGTASGINNAVARVAGVLAIAVFGAVMLSAFSWRLNQGLNQMSIPAAIMKAIQANQVKLAGLQPPSGLDARNAAAVKQLVGEAFGFGFRIVMTACAVLSLAAAGIAGLTIPPRAHAVANRSPARTGSAIQVD
jgi:MFS family permease